MSLSACRECQGDVSPDAVACPHCGAPHPSNPKWNGWGFEWKSQATVAGIPFVHIAFGRDKRRRLRVARGFIAIGQYAVGVLTIAQFGIGVMALTQFGAAVAILSQFGAGAYCVGQFSLAIFEGRGQFLLLLKDYFGA